MVPEHPLVRRRSPSCSTTTPSPGPDRADRMVPWPATVVPLGRRSYLGGRAGRFPGTRTAARPVRGVDAGPSAVSRSWAVWRPRLGRGQGRRERDDGRVEVRHGGSTYMYRRAVAVDRGRPGKFSAVRAGRGRHPAGQTAGRRRVCGVEEAGCPMARRLGRALGDPGAACRLSSTEGAGAEHGHHPITTSTSTEGERRAPEPRHRFMPPVPAQIGSGRGRPSRRYGVGPANAMPGTSSCCQPPSLQWPLSGIRGEPDAIIVHTAGSDSSSPCHPPDPPPRFVPVG